MASDYSGLKTEIQQWLDNNNPNLIAAIPSFIQFAESWFRRNLHTRDMECRARHVLVPTGTADEDRGIYTLPTDWGGHRTVEVGEQNIDLLYWQRIPALTDQSPTNFLLTKQPDLYLYASLAQAESWLKNDPRIPVWASYASTAIEEVQAHDEHDKYSGGPLTSRHPFQRPWRHYSETAGRYDYLPPFDFFELDLSGLLQGQYQKGSGYFTVAEDKLRIWPRPTIDPTGSSGWATCS